MQVTIDRCYFRGTRQAIAVAHKSLERTRFPAIGDNEFVIIRELRVTGQSVRLEQAYYRRTERLLAAKVNGWLSDAADADCIWFSSETDLYACLCRDMALGRADSLWYWRQFRQPSSDAPPRGLIGLLLQQATQLPALIVHLHERAILPLVWQRLNNEDKAVLWHEVVSRSLQTAIEKVAAQVVIPETTAISAGELPPMLAAMHSEAGLTGLERTLEQRLALALYLLAARPHQVLSQQVEPEVRALWRMIAKVEQPLTGQGTAVSMRAPVVGGEGEEAIEPLTAPGEEDASATLKPPFTPGREAEATQVMEPAETAGMSQPPLEKRFDAESDIPQTSDSAPEYGAMIESVDATEAYAEQLPFTEEWYVSQGGLFYLLNLLNHSVIRDLLLNNAEAVAFPSGWGWLYRLGEAFGLQYERELVRCLARLSGQEEQLFLDTTPQLKAAEEILAFGEQRYRHFGIWHSGLLHKPVHIGFLRPELTISYRMHDLDVALRKAGLDIDPGWVDWLGAMVRFRYREAV